MERKISEEFASQFTPAVPITRGVRQGDALSSLLFDLVLEAVMNMMNIREYIGIKTTHIIPCVDDVAIISRNKNSFKKSVGLINMDSKAMERETNVS